MERTGEKTSIDGTFETRRSVEKEKSVFISEKCKKSEAITGGEVLGKKNTLRRRTRGQDKI